MLKNRVVFKQSKRRKLNHSVNRHSFILSIIILYRSYTTHTIDDDLGDFKISSPKSGASQINRQVTGLTQNKRNLPQNFHSKRNLHEAVDYDDAPYTQSRRGHTGRFDRKKRVSSWEGEEAENLTEE